MLEPLTFSSKKAPTAEKGDNIKKFLELMAEEILLSDHSRKPVYTLLKIGKSPYFQKTKRDLCMPGLKSGVVEPLQYSSDE